MMEELQVLRELVVTLRKERDDTLALLATSDVRSHIEEDDDNDDDPEMDVSPSTPTIPRVRPGRTFHLGGGDSRA
jgi:hypothetical protein